VSTLWAADEPGGAVTEEHVVPTGAFHVVLRVRGRVQVDGADLRTPGVVGGARSAPYRRHIGDPAASVGAMIRPGAAGLLFGVSARELAERHTKLDDVWSGVAALRDELADLDARARLACFERFLVARLPNLRGIHPAVLHATMRFEHGAAVAEVVDETGWSTRRFYGLFRDAVGLSPKRFSRVRRVASVLPHVHGERLAQVAYGAGFADHAHLSRDFRALTGMTPSDYRRLAIRHPHHVPLDRLEARDPLR